MAGSAWPSGRGLAARPDQVVRAVFLLDQAGVDGRRERGVVQRHREVGAFGLAELLPGGADVVAGAGLDAVVGGVLAALVVAHELDLDVERQGPNGADEAVVLSGEGADVGHGDFLSGCQGRAHRVLVVIRQAGDGRAAPRSAAKGPQQRGGPAGTGNLPREESAQRRGNFLGRTVAAIKPEAQPRPRQDSRQDKDAWDAPFPKGLKAEHVHHVCVETSAATTLAPSVRVATAREALAASTRRLAPCAACQVHQDRASTLRSSTPPTDLPASVGEEGTPGNPAQRAEE